ncbi:Uncharacterised protein [Mycobacterium tuberculosis]|nr:hypothetical protein MRGA327_00310 [Mycobacterium tuberculosis RGTB327]CNM37330.1 Uncharacterised protein [Mycobacterium tuberculosis]CNM47280.1 Uncharacterised protein [Mycobacterium tuberculosis]CNM76173.1 Uncharacterised protein [Mycobacterium tuberculosis]CNM92974.1 Uncharacterised protein [Mycobacterium tuberculosis]
MPAYRATDDIRQSGTQYVGAAGAIAVIGAPQIGGQRKWRDVAALGQRAGHGGGVGVAAGGAGGGGARVMVVGGPIGMVIPGAISTVGWMTVSEGGTSDGGGGGGTPA